MLRNGKKQFLQKKTSTSTRLSCEPVIKLFTVLFLIYGAFLSVVEPYYRLIQG